MVMRALSEGAKKGVSKIILLGFMSLAVAGLMLMDVGGFFRGGVSSNDVAKVGHTDISAPQFDQILRQQLSNLGLSTPEAYEQGLVFQILAGEVRRHVLAQSGEQYGMSISQSEVAEHIRMLMAPMLEAGGSPRLVLQQWLTSMGMSEQQLAATIERQMKADLVTDAVNAGFVTVSPLLIQDLHRYDNETRTVEFLPLPVGDISSELPEPADSQLLSYYESIQGRFSVPEYRDLQILKIDTSSLEDTLEVTDEDVQAVYDRDIDLYSKPRQWILDQALLDAPDQAQKVAELARDGKDLQAAVKEVTGGTSAYIGEKASAESEILSVFKDDVLAGVKGDVIGPVSSPLGQYVIKIKDITEPSTRPLEEVADEIRQMILDEQLIDQRYALANMVDDMLAGGAPLEEVREQVDLEVTDLPPVNASGQTRDGQSILSDRPDKRETFLETGFELFEGETSPVIESLDGELTAIHLESIAPAHTRPFEDVRDSVKNMWMAEQARAENRARADSLLEQARREGLSLQELAEKNALVTVKTIEGLKRGPGAADDKMDDDIPVQSRPAVFAAPPNEILNIPVEDGLALAVVKNMTLPEPLDPQSEEYQRWERQLRNTQQNIALSLYIDKKAADIGAHINEALLQQLYDPAQQGF